MSKSNQTLEEVIAQRDALYDALKMARHIMGVEGASGTGPGDSKYDNARKKISDAIKLVDDRIEVQRDNGAAAHAAKYPEHYKLKAVKAQSEAIGRFIEWLNENGYSICEKREPYSKSSELRKMGIETDSRLADNLGDKFVEFFNLVADNACVYWPTFTTTQKILAKHFDIDLNKIDDEKRAMLDEMRAANEGE